MDKKQLLIKLRHSVDYRADRLTDYMNTYFTQEERNNHGDNLWRFVHEIHQDITMLQMMDLMDGKTELNLSTDDENNLFGHLNKNTYP